MLVSDGRLITKSPSFPVSTTDWWYEYERVRRSSAYGTLYASSLWVKVVVNKRALATARLPLKVYLRDDLNRPEVRDHPYAQLLRNPNANVDPFRFWEWTSSTFDIYGEAFWFKLRDQGGRPVQLIPLHPTAMTLSPNGRWDYSNTTGTRLLDIPPSDLVHFCSYNPDDMTRGLSPLEPLRDTLENEYAARTATSSFWRNGARPGVALVHPSTLSQPAADRLKANWDAQAGGAGKTGSTVVLEEGMEPKVLSLSAEEAQYIETRKLNREEVCAAYDVPPPVVHILDHATYANITEQMRSIYRDTVAPHLKRLESTMEAQLRVPDFGGEVYAEFLMDDVLRGDFEARATALAQSDWMTMAEKRKMENLPFVEGTDQIFVNSAIVPLDRAIEPPQPPPPQLLPAGPALPGPSEPLSAANARSVVGRLGWQDSLAQVDAQVLTKGLNGEAAAVLDALAEARAAGDDVAAFRA